MTRAAVVWAENGHLRVAEVPEHVPCVIGRAPDAGVVVNNQTVSRQHALIRAQAGVFLVEHLSRVNPTWVNNVVVDRPTRLADGNALRVGTVELVFHDLAAADQVVSRFVCGHCQRENKRTDKECWYCGTSLVTAPSATLQRIYAVCRIVPAGGGAHTLYPGDRFLIRPGGGGELQRSGTIAGNEIAAVEIRDNRPVLVLRAPDPSLTVNDRPAVDGQPLRTGDEIQAGPARFAVIAR
jgi:hypothetical protein